MDDVLLKNLSWIVKNVVENCGVADENWHQMEYIINKKPFKIILFTRDGRHSFSFINLHTTEAISYTHDLDTYSIQEICSIIKVMLEFLQIGTFIRR